MPYTSASPFAPPPILIEQSKVDYLLGSRNTRVSPSKFYVTNVALTSNVATISVSQFEGEVPTVGSLLTVVGSQNTSGLFNVVNAPITAISLNSSQVGTIQFALTHANVTSAADSGTAIVPQAEVGETAAVGFTIAGSLAFPPFSRSTNAVFAELTLPAAGVTALTVTMQVSDDNANWVSTSTVLTIAGGVVTAGSGYFETTAPFVRGALTGLTGSGPVALKVNI